MPDAIDVEIRGLEEAQKKAEQLVAEMFGPPMLEAMRDATLYVQRDAKINAPVDTGRLRASIIPAIRSSAEGVQGVIGSNVKYAPYMELGTRPHWVPAKYIGRWAELHGLGFRAVFVKGKAREFFKRAINDNKDRIIKRFQLAVDMIVRK